MALTGTRAAVLARSRTRRRVRKPRVPIALCMMAILLIRTIRVTSFYETYPA
jgi:hypothetical protein